MSHTTNSRRIVFIIYQSLGSLCCLETAYITYQSFNTFQFSAVTHGSEHGSCPEESLTWCILCSLLPSLMYLPQPHNILAMVQLFFILKINLVFTKGARPPALKTAAWCLPPEQVLPKQQEIMLCDTDLMMCLSPSESVFRDQLHLQTNSFLTA